MATKKKKVKVSKITTFTVQLPTQLHVRLKSRRAKTGESMRDILIKALERDLKKAA